MREKTPSAVAINSETIAARHSPPRDLWKEARSALHEIMFIGPGMLRSPSSWNSSWTRQWDVVLVSSRLTKCIFSMNGCRLSRCIPGNLNPPCKAPRPHHNCCSLCQNCARASIRGMHTRFGPQIQEFSSREARLWASKYRPHHSTNSVYHPNQRVCDLDWPRPNIIFESIWIYKTPTLYSRNRRRIMRCPDSWRFLRRSLPARVFLLRNSFGWDAELLNYNEFLPSSPSEKAKSWSDSIRKRNGWKLGEFICYLCQSEIPRQKMSPLYIL